MSLVELFPSEYLGGQSLQFEQGHWIDVLLQLTQTIYHQYQIKAIQITPGVIITPVLLGMLKTSKSQKLVLFSKDVGSLPDYQSTKHLLPVMEEDIVYPRVFPSQKIPLKVALARRIKSYLEFDLSQALKDVPWKQGKALMDLKHFNFQLCNSIEECTQQRLQKGIIRGRALYAPSNSFLPFTAVAIEVIQQDTCARGFFDHESESQVVMSKFYICLNFQDPERYVRTVEKAIQNRQQFLSNARYNFYVDNIDLQESISMPKKVLNGITQRVGVSLLDLPTFLQLNNLFKRTMNELLFQHTLLNSPELVIENIKRRETTKPASYRPKKRVIKLTKDNKVYKLVLKSMKNKIEDIQTKTLLFRDALIFLLHEANDKIGQISKHPLFDLTEEVKALERLAGDNLLMVGYFTHYLNTKVITPMAKTIRKELEEHPEGWFNLMKTDRDTYLMSKLRRLFILIEQSMKDTLKSHVKFEVNRYNEKITKRLPSSIVFQSFTDFTFEYEPHQKGISQLQPMLMISVAVSSQTLKLQMGKEKTEQQLVKNVENVLQKIERIESPQNKVLFEIFAIYKHQYDISLELPLQMNGKEDQHQGQNFNTLQYQWIQKDLKSLYKAISELAEPLSVIETHLESVASQLKLPELSRDSSVPPNLKVENIIQKLALFGELSDKLEQLLPCDGIPFGPYFIDYRSAKLQIVDLLDTARGTYKNSLIKEYQHFSLKLEKEEKALQAELEIKPLNIYEMVKQRQKIENLTSLIEEFNQDYQIHLFQLCEKQNCYLGKADFQRRWKNTGRIAQLYKMEQVKQKEYHEFKKDIGAQIEKQVDDIKDVLQLFDVTLSIIKCTSERRNHEENCTKLGHLQKQYLSLKQEIQDIRYKQLHLQLPHHDFQLFEDLEEDFLVQYHYWDSIRHWEILREIWYHKPFGEFQLDKPETALAQISNNIEKIDKTIKKKHPEQYALISEIRQEVQNFEDKHLKLLKILKKDGFTNKHLQKIGIFIDISIEELTLKEALDKGFMDKMEDIEAISNEAWNEFYLEQTLERVLGQLVQIKYEVIYYLDKKANQIPLINNYEFLNEKVEQVILELQAVQFNPMKHHFQKRINDLYDKSLYISKSLQGSQTFQKKLVELHPIFDSTDVVKQLPHENKLFTKVLRSWVQLGGFMKKIMSVYDSCNSQNIAEKTTSMIKHIELVKIGLANYLQQKRQSFSRFYLLTDQQMYELYASTKDIHLLSKHISKLFHQVQSFAFDDTHIQAAEGSHHSLRLQHPVSYQKLNLEEWLTNFERSLRETLRLRIMELIGRKNKWTNLLGECSQALLLAYEIEKTHELEGPSGFQKMMERQRGMIRRLVEVKKSSQLGVAQTVNLGSLLVLALFYSEKLGHLLNSGVTDLDHFQIKRILKIRCNEERITLQSFETEVEYGYEYLGLMKRLVLTNLTERMQLIYMSALRYSLGGAAVGPAGTGKSQTTKDIARVCGKNCIIYNCSESLGMGVLIKILKGMAVTGLWVCLDEFNRLHHQVLRVMSEQLAILFKYKAIGMKLEVQYEKERILFRPDFHLCVTYNPSYVGRQDIPKHLARHFRTVAMVNCDRQVICQLILYSKGFQHAERISQRLNRLFNRAQELWQDFSLYDFGLRALISIIQLAGILYHGQGDGVVQVIEAIRILVLPRLSPHHGEILVSLARNILQELPEKQPSKGELGEAAHLKHVLQVRIGIILLGDIFSGKTTTMKLFEESYQDYRVQHIHINALSVPEIYGETDPSTRIFKDGYLTKLIRQHILDNSPHKLLIHLEGVIFSHWIQNLNSVLDNSRSLSLPSGQILSIPQDVKFLINCSHLQFASPATISRSCLISLPQKSLKEMLICPQGGERVRNNIIDTYQEIMMSIRDHIEYAIDQRLFFHWFNKCSAKAQLPFSTQSFWHLFSLVLGGCLSNEGKRIFSSWARGYFALEQNIFQLFWEGRNWKPLTEVVSLSVKPEEYRKIPNEVVYKGSRYRFVEYMNKIFTNKASSWDELLLLVGPPHSGKSSILQHLNRSLDNRVYVLKKLDLTRTMQREQLYDSINDALHRKSNRRKGMLQGRQLVFFLDDMNLPLLSPFKYRELIAVLTMLLEKRGCINYGTLQFQTIEDTLFVGSYHSHNRMLNLSKQFLKFTLPLFLREYSQSETVLLFREVIEQSNSIVPLTPLYHQLAHNLAGIMETVKLVQQRWLPSYLAFQFTHFRRIVSNVLGWNITSHNTDSSILNKLFCFETERILLSRLKDPIHQEEARKIVREGFRLNQDDVVLLHGFDRTANGTGIDTSICNKVSDLEELMREVDYICDQYLLSLDKKESLIALPELCVFLCRVSRGLSLLQGHVSIVGLPKCGKKVLLELCNYLLHGKMYKIKDNYDQKQWYQVLRTSTKQSLSSHCHSVLLLEQHQLKNELQKEELNIMLKGALVIPAYAEADYEELTYLLQSVLIRQQVAVNKENTLLFFKRHLQQKHRIVLMFNPMTKQFRQDLFNFPAICKHTQFYWLTDWPTPALLSMATNSLLDPLLVPYLSLFPLIHESSKEMAKGTSVPHWEGLYLDFLSKFEHLQLQSKEQLRHQLSTLDKSFNIIKQTQVKLQATRDEIKSLQPKILILEKQTMKTIKSLNIQKANAETANQKLMKKENQCTRIIAETNAVKMKLQTINAKVEEELQKAWENVYLVKQSHIAEIKALMNPSDLIRIVITAIIIVLNEGDIEIIKAKSEDGLSIEENYFQTGKRFILSKDSKQITRLLTEYKKEKLNKQKIALLEQKCLNHPRWNIVEAKNANRAIYYFFIWIEAVVKYFRLYQEAMPMRTELEKATSLFEAKSKEVEVVKKELSIYQQKIGNLSLNLKEKNEKLEQYTRQIKMFEKMLSRGYQILKEIQSQKEKWQNYRDSIEEEMKLNIGNSIVCSFLIVYAAPHSVETRRKMLETVKGILADHEVSINKDDIFWLLEKEEEIVLKEMGIYHDDYILNNLKIIQKTSKPTFLVDPEEESFKYLRIRLKLKGIMFLNRIHFQHPSFNKVLRNTISDGALLFIQISGQDLPPIIAQLIAPTIRKNVSNGNTQIYLQDKFLPFFKPFKLYFFTTSQRQDFAIELLSKVTTVNFSITEAQLKQKLVSLVVSIQFPQENQELQELNKTNIKDNIQLRNIETRILNIFASMESAEQILKTQQILQVLSTSNRLYSQIQDRIQESVEKRNGILARRDHFKARCGKAAKLYFQIQKISHLSRYYQYSLEWFINLFKKDFSNFSQTLSKELTKGLPSDLKIIAPLLVAASEYPKIPFHHLFSPDIEKSKLVKERYSRLKVGKVRLEKIVANIKLIQLDQLDAMAREHPEKLDQLLVTPIESILQAIPDQFSQCEFFKKIQIINCFRPDCTIKLLTDWLNINMGPVFGHPNKLLEHSQSNLPILVLENKDNQFSTVAFIETLYESNLREIRRSVGYINCNNSPLQMVKIGLESAFSNDQWLVMEGLGEHPQDTIALIIAIFEELDFKRKESFRLWLVLTVQELGSASDKLIKLSTKVVLEEQVELIKKMGNAFQSEVRVLRKEESDFNKKKYLLNELVIFHFMLNEKYAFKEKLWNQPQYFEEWELSLNLKYLQQTSAEELKRLYPDIVTNIVYGGKVTDPHDVQTILLHIRQALRATNLDRNSFWQSVWADDKFPKTQQEHEHYLKTVLHKHTPPFGNVHQIYGITSFVRSHAKQTQFSQIARFHHSATHPPQSQDILEGARALAHDFTQKIGKHLHKFNTNINEDSKNPLRYFLIDEQQHYLAQLQLITLELKHYLEAEEIFLEEQHLWCVHVTTHRLPPSWGVKTILTLESWLDSFLEGIIYIFGLNLPQTQSPRYPLQLIHYFPSLCQALFDANDCTPQSHFLLWEPQKVDLVSNSTTFKVQRWYLWNAEFDKTVVLLAEGTVKEHYYSPLPRGFLSVMEKEAVKKLGDFAAVGVYSHSFEYGDCPRQMSTVLMPVAKTGDENWLLRTRVHLTLAL